MPTTRIRELSTTLVLAAFLGGCGVPLVQMRPVGDNVTYDRGRALVVSDASNSRIAVQPATGSYERQARAEFWLFAENSGPQTIDFSEADITVRVNGEPARVLTADELRQEAADDASSARTSARIAAAFRGLSASQTGTRQTTTTVTSPRGTTTIQSTTTDPGAAQAAQRENALVREAHIATANAVETDAVARIAGSAIARTTLRPGQSLTGFFVVESEELNDPFAELCKVELRAKLGADEHTLIFEQKNQE